MRLTTLFLIIIFCFSCSDIDHSENEFSTIDKEILENSKAYATLKEATSVIGHRLTGSRNGEKAEEYVYNKLKEYGFDNVSYQPFEVEAWSRGTVRLDVTHQQSSASIAVVSLGHSPISADVSATIVDMGNGLEEDYNDIGDKLKNQLALIFIGLPDSLKTTHKNLHRSEKARLAIDHGAVGVIIFNQVPNGVLLTGTASVTGRLLPVPAVCIGYEDGLTIREMLQKNNGPVTASLSMTNKSGPINARNIVATLKGSDLPEEKIVIGGHLDSWDLATGAIDNGIGSFAVLDIARSFKANNLKPRRTIQFVLFMGEEQGLLGSRYYVAKANEDGSVNNIRLMMNLDMTGNPVGINVTGKAMDTIFFSSLGNKINAIDTIYKAKFSSRAGLHSDHQPFMLDGVPVLGMRSNLDPKIYRCYHADCDDFNLVNEKHIRNTTRFGTMVLFAIANADPFPVSQMDSEETREFMIANGLEDNLKMQGDWRW